MGIRVSSLHPMAQKKDGVSQMREINCDMNIVADIKLLILKEQI